MRLPALKLFIILNIVFFTKRYILVNRPNSLEGVGKERKTREFSTQYPPNP